MVLIWVVSLLRVLFRVMVLLLKVLVCFILVSSNVLLLFEELAGVGLMLKVLLVFGVLLSMKF